MHKKANFGNGNIKESGEMAGQGDARAMVQRKHRNWERERRIPNVGKW